MRKGNSKRLRSGHSLGRFSLRKLRPARPDNQPMAYFTRTLIALAGTAVIPSPRPAALRKHEKVSIIGAPTDIGAGTRGASMGPEALRVAQLQAMLESQGVEVADRGNLQGPGNPGPAARRRLPPPVRRSSPGTARCYEACRAEFAAARLPILVGGDHSLAIGSIAAAAQHAREQRPQVPRALVRRARGHQYERPDAERQHPRHAGRDPARPRARANSSRSAGRRPSMQPVRDPPDRHPQRGPRREALRPRARVRSLRHALHRRDRHARRR